MFTFSRTRKSSMVAAALTIGLSCVCGHRASATPIASVNLDVVASVNVACTIATVPVAFGIYDPVGVNAVTPLDTLGGVSVNCSAGGANIRVTLGQGTFPQPGSTNINPLRRMGSGPGRLRYNLYSDAAHAAVWNNQTGVKTGKIFPVLMSVYGRVPAAQIVPSGAYADNILATVTF
ncbi:MAG TPA: spore coat U domain-containing protein [Polyangiales bacterium]